MKKEKKYKKEKKRKKCKYGGHNRVQLDGTNQLFGQMTRLTNVKELYQWISKGPIKTRNKWKKKSKVN